MSQISEGKWSHLKTQAQKHNARFVRCNGVVYEVLKLSFATGPSPMWDISVVNVVDVPLFTEEGETS